MANRGQQARIAARLKRNLDQILVSSLGLSVTVSTNAVGDTLVAIADASWSSTDPYALIKIQEIPLSTFPVQGLPVHKLMICVEGDNATLSSGKGSAIDAGLLCEYIARAKDMGCDMEVYITELGTQPADQATAGGTFNGGSAGSRLMRVVRASVDTIGMGQ